jgi:putative tryptophan/tyrosine transport system substrate-binding protein
MIRRSFIVLLGGAALAGPFAARAEQSAMPLIGLLGSASADEAGRVTDALRAGLKDAGLTEGRNVAIEYRWAGGQYGRLPALAEDLVNHQVALIVTAGAEPSALAAKSATSTIPIIFVIEGDPVSIGLVDSLNRPGGNATGMSLIASSLEPKRLELLRELMPQNTMIAVLVNPDYADTDFQLGGLQAAANKSGQQIYVLNASTDDDIATAFTNLAQQGAGALLVAADPFFNQRRDEIVALAAGHKVPAIYSSREFVAAGGLMSYGASIADAYHGAGNYAGRILGGAKPMDLPVQQPTTFELVINLRVAKALGLTVPNALLAIADEVVE